LSVKEFWCSLSSKQNPVLKFYVIYDLIDRFFFPTSVTRCLSDRRKRTQEKLTHNTSLSRVILESASPDFMESYLLRVTKSAILLIKCSIRTYFFHALTALVGLDILIVEVSISHSDTPH